MECLRAIRLAGASVSPRIGHVNRAEYRLHWRVSRPAEVQIATVRNQVLLSMFTDFENFSVFKPGPQQTSSVNAMLDQLIAWGGALKTLRKPVFNGML
jgi:hypothetical protein